MLGRGVLSRLHCLTQQESYTLTLYLDIDQNKQSNRNRGYVVQADNDQVVVNLGAGQGVVPGTEFDIVEPSAPMQYRGRQLQAQPKVIGQVEIVKVESDFCQGRIINTTRPIARDDMLREKITEPSRSKL